MNTIEQRLSSIRKEFPILNIDGLLITNPTNIRWLSGFTGSYSRLLITNEQAILGTDSRYWIQGRAEAPDYTLLKDNRRSEDTEFLLKEAGVQRVGIESCQVTIAEAETLKKIEGITWVPLNATIENLRQYKNSLEIEAISAAAAITDKAMALVPELTKAGISERELAWLLEKAMRESGADGLAFPSIIAFGPNSALPHHTPGDRTLNEEEVVLVDMGAELNGYKSDLTRSFYFGRKNDQFQQIFDIVFAAQEKAMQGIQDGAMSDKVVLLAIDVIAERGYGDNFQHGLGHSLGLDIHEIPFLSLHRQPVELQSGMVVTVEPGIYLEDWGGVRIEDLVLITDAGFQTISRCPKLPYISPGQNT